MSGGLKKHDAFRVQALLREAIKKFHFLGTVMQSMKNKGRDDVTEMMGDEISRIISEQRNLENQYANLVKKRENLTGISNKQEYIEVKAQIQEIANALRQNTKHLCRVLKDNPNLQDNLIKIERDRQQIVRTLQDLILDLFTMNYHSFSYKVTQELQSHDLLSKLKQSQKQISQNAKQLQQDYQKQKLEYQNQSKEAQLQIQRRRQQLDQVKTFQQFRTKYQRKQAQAQLDCEKRLLQQQEKNYDDQIADLMRKRDNQIKVHDRLKQFMDMKFQSINTESEQWKVKHQQDVRELSIKIDAMNQRKERAKKHLEAMNEEIEQEKRRQMEREREEKEREDRLTKEREDNERKTAACEVIAREFMKYKELAAKLRPKKKRGGGKKKK